MWEKELEVCKEAAVLAGSAILDIYNSVEDMEVEYKEGNMPLTVADKASNDIIVRILRENFPTYAILSEEEKDNPDRLLNDYCFVVDPLDGTKEFIKRNGQFTVNIALAYKGRAVVGVIYVPVADELYFAGKDGGAYLKDTSGAVIELCVTDNVKCEKMKAVLSGSHGCKEMEDLLEKYEMSDFVKVGSSLKGCMVASGNADVYYRHNPTMEWDTAAMQCIVEEAGGLFRQMDLTPMCYNRENSLNENGFLAINSYRNLFVKHSYLITGVTGFIGSLLVKTLMSFESYKKGDMCIYGLVRDVEKAKKMYEDYDCQNLHFIEGDICDRRAVLSLKELAVDYIIHCAATTQSKEMIEKPVETLDGLTLGTKNILDLAHELKVKSMVMLSSMEVYGIVEDNGHLRSEEELGEIVLNEARSCYPLGKRLAEHYCYLYKKEYEVPVKVARLSQVFGKGVRLDDNRVYMQFARAVREDRDIVLKTDGMSMGNYCDSEDAVEAILTILFKGEDGQTYNVVNEENTMHIRELANLVAEKISGGKIQVKYELEDRAQTGYAGKTGLRMSAKKLRGLGWKPTKDLEEMFGDVILKLN